MFDFQRPAYPARGSSNPHGLLGFSVGAMATFWLGPQIYDPTLAWVRGYGAAHYGLEYEWLLTIGWAIFVGLATFSATKFVFGAALRLGIFGVIRGRGAPHHFHHRY